MLSVLPAMTLVLASFLFQVKTEADSVLQIIWDDKKLDGWSLQDNGKYYLSDQCIDYYPGLKDVFYEYGLKELLVLNFIDTGDQVIHAEIHRMHDNGGAYGLFSVSRDTTGTLAGFGDEAYKSNKGIFFWKGNYYIKVSTDLKTSSVKEGLGLIAKSIDHRIDEEGKRPEIIDILPEEGFVTERTRYFRGGAGLNFNLRPGYREISGFLEGVYSDFGTHQLILLDYESPEASLRWLEKISEHYDNSEQYDPVHKDFAGYRFMDGEGSYIVFGSFGKYIMIFSGKDITRQPEIFERVEDLLLEDLLLEDLSSAKD